MEPNMKRDQYDIIIQPDGLKIEVAGSEVVVDDGGDSAFSTGLNGFGGSVRDKQLMPLFITQDNRIVRHPYQTYNTGTHPHNHPDGTSRDAVLAFFSGFDHQADKQVHNSTDYQKIRLACLNYANSWWINKDFNSPANRLYLYKRAGYRAPLYISILGRGIMALNITWTCLATRFYDKEFEVNQEFVQSATYGKLWFGYLKLLHPHLSWSLKFYFCKWRQRCEIALNLIKTQGLEDVAI
jgi:hypothetical protein